MAELAGSRKQRYNKGAQGCDEQKIFSNSFLIIAELIAAVAKFFTFDAAHMVLTLHMEHGHLGRAASPGYPAF